MNTRTRAYALFLALLLAVVSAFSAFAEGGDGSGGGDNHDKPLTVDFEKSNIRDGEKNVDANKSIQLYFTKNVVNIVVRENNMKCFSVSDSKGESFPITVEMGDDQIEPTDVVKRTVTIVPQKPYASGETYTLTVKKGLAAKNGRDVLDEDITILFTIAGETTTVNRYVPHYSPDTTTATTTTTKPPETTTRAPRTTKPVILAATGTTASKTETTVQAARTAVTQTKQTASTSTATVSRTSAVTLTASTTTVSPVAEQTEIVSETFLQSEPAATEETTAFYDPAPETVTAQTETHTVAVSSDVRTEEKAARRSPALFIGIFIALAAAAGVIIGIVFRKKKG